jgi:hypothetical protein
MINRGQGEGRREGRGEVGGEGDQIPVDITPGERQSATTFVLLRAHGNASA